MAESETFAFVFLVAGRTTMSFRSALKKPGAARGVAFNRTIRTLTRSRYTHCALGLPPYVIDSSFDGSEVYDFEGWLAGRPDLAGWFAVPTHRWPDRPWDFVTGTQKRNFLVYETRRLLCWASRGIVYCDDCVDLVRRGLSGCGVKLPRSVASPAAIWKHFNGRGLEFNTCDDRAVSGVAGEDYASDRRTDSRDSRQRTAST